MTGYLYRVGKRREKRRRKTRVIIWLIVLIMIILLLVWGFVIIRGNLTPKTTIKQSSPIVSSVNAPSTQTKRYTETDFSIAIPASWQMLPRPVPNYQTYTWSSGPTTANEQQIEIYEDTIPSTFTVNRVLVVEGEVDHLLINGTASDNCVNFTENLSPTLAQPEGTVAKWEGVQFLCDRSNTEADVIGTSSTDGINTVILKTSLGVSHKFFFIYTDHTLTPDYTVFYNALNSFAMQ